MNKLLKKLGIFLFLFAVNSTAFCQPLPGGPYTKSCNWIHISGNTLFAECMVTTANGVSAINISFPNVSNCLSLENNQGHLVCLSVAPRYSYCMSSGLGKGRPYETPEQFCTTWN